MAQTGKMMAMQAAAKDMIDTLSNYDKQTGDVCISIIPFSKDGNVGATNVSASINWTEWEAAPYSREQQIQRLQLGRGRIGHDRHEPSQHQQCGRKVSGAAGQRDLDADFQAARREVILVRIHKRKARPDLAGLLIPGAC